MNHKNFILYLILIAGIFLSISFTSAALCLNSKGYYDDCGYRESSTKISKPIFKGSYGNYAYQAYAQKQEPEPPASSAFTTQLSYHRSYGPYFSGGFYYPYYGGGYGFSSYSGYGMMGYGGYGWGSGGGGYYSGYGYPYFYSGWW